MDYYRRLPGKLLAERVGLDLDLRAALDLIGDYTLARRKPPMLKEDAAACAKHCNIERDHWLRLAAELVRQGWITVQDGKLMHADALAELAREKADAEARSAKSKAGGRARGKQQTEAKKNKGLGQPHADPINEINDLGQRASAR